MTAKQPQHLGKILLVDDDPGLLRLLSIRLRAEGYDVEAVESAHKALGVLNRFGPDLVITDLVAWPARHHHYGTRHHPGRRNGHAARRVRLPDQTYRQGRAHVVGRPGAEGVRPG